MKMSELKSRMDPERLRHLEATAAKEVKEIHLGWMREAATKTQRDVAAVLGVSQAAVSGIEGRSDLLISTLRKYVEALDGSVNIVVNLPGGRFIFDTLTEAFRMVNDTPKPDVVRRFSCVKGGVTTASYEQNSLGDVTKTAPSKLPLAFTIESTKATHVTVDDTENDRLKSYA